MSVDPTLLVLSFVISVLGSFVGFQSARRARQRTGAPSLAWLAAAALCIGGAAIWSMHFIGMLAYRQDVTHSLSANWTLLTLVIAIVAAGIGLYITSRGKGSGSRYLGAGAITGLGVAGMLYLGRYSVQAHATLDFRLWVVGLSVLIAVATASIVLFLAATVTSAWTIVVASVVVAIGLSAARYTVTLAVTVRPNLDLATSSAAGVDPLSLALRVFALASVALFGLMFVVAFDDADRSESLAVPQVV